jgi:thiamine pyrophosphate-dependent acetolactate synthase large subunit-like protein
MLHRRELVSQLMDCCGNAAVITGLGSPAYDVAAAGDRDENFYLWGAMGGAAMVGLGVAMGQPERRVLVITGDGEALMGAGSFAVIAAQNPSNLAILILDNQLFGETGGQAGLTAKGTDIAALASAGGVRSTFTTQSRSGVPRLQELLFDTPGPVVCVARIDAAGVPRVLPPRDGQFLHQRFRRAMIPPEGVDQYS